MRDADRCGSSNAPEGIQNKVKRTRVLRNLRSLTAPSGELRSDLICQICQHKGPVQGPTTGSGGRDQSFLERYSRRHTDHRNCSAHEIASDSVRHSRKSHKFLKRSKNFDKINQGIFLKASHGRDPSQTHPPPQLKALGHPCGRAQCACPFALSRPFEPGLGREGVKV